jgi:hypothetical protein
MNDDVAIYQSEPDETIELLAELDSSSCPRGPVLVAAVAGEARAALPLNGGPVIADPFHRSAELVSLLEVRAAQLNRRSSPHRFLTLPARLHRAGRLALVAVTAT